MMSKSERRETARTPKHSLNLVWLAFLAAVVVVAAIVSAGGPANSHTLPGSTATVALRDGLVTVTANLDIQRWMRSQKRGELQTMVASAKSQARELAVMADGKAVPMTLRGFPSVEEVHLVLQRRAPTGHNPHPKVIPVRWEATRAVPGVSAVSVRFPKAVGKVLVSFVEPQSRMVPAGGLVSFGSRQAGASAK